MKSADGNILAFCTYVKKVKGSRRTGSGSEDVYKSTWFAYEHMARFLLEKDELRHTLNTETIWPEEEEVGDLAPLTEETGTLANPQNGNTSVILPPNAGYCSRTDKRKRKTAKIDEIKKKMDDAYSVLQSCSAETS